jgi:ribosome-associated translation inhibitor RaiA
LALIGEAGPEAVIPLDRMTQTSHVTVEINAPLVNVEGNADRRTVELAVDQVMKKLKTVVVEATSGNAPSTQRRIRSGSVFT